MAQPAARGSHNPKVVSSILTVRTFRKPLQPREPVLAKSNTTTTQRSGRFGKMKPRESNEQLAALEARWSSGLRRQIKALLLRGVGSNPTLVKFFQTRKTPQRQNRTAVDLSTYRFEACTPHQRSSSRQKVVLRTDCEQDLHGSICTPLHSLKYAGSFERGLQIVGFSAGEQQPKDPKICRELRVRDKNASMTANSIRFLFLLLFHVNNFLINSSIEKPGRASDGKNNTRKYLNCQDLLNCQKVCVWLRGVSQKVLGEISKKKKQPQHLVVVILKMLEQTIETHSA